MFSPTEGSRPYHGSCHCGFTKYVAFLKFPPPETSAGGDNQTLYKCNCSTCHKLGLLHLGVPSAPDNFLLLSPSDPFKELEDYQCFGKFFHWFFCKSCGGRCFSFVGEGEHVEVDLASLGIAGAEAGKKTTVWRPKKEGWGATPYSHYLVLNASSIDAAQEGFDMREWVDKGWLKYMDGLSMKAPGMPPIADKPFSGGTY